jgi:putative sugar O-methyltransferase
VDERSRAEIRNIKSKVIAMLEERQSLESSETSLVSPSRYWSDFCSYFDYMLGLPEEYFAKLRLHTYHLTSDNYQTYYFGDPEYFRSVSGLEMLTKDIPSTYILNEPEGGIGFHYDNGRFVSRDIVRYQRVVSTLYRHGVLRELSSRERSYVLEIGGGYGGLAHHISNICRNATYVIIDLPETLLFSASYLSLLDQRKKIYIYERKDFPEIIQSGALQSCDFVLLPNYKLHSLTHLRFDLVVNVASLQEMRTSQAEAYLDFIRETCSGVFYSWNQDHQPRNKELADLSDLLRQRFDLIEVLDWQLDNGKKKIGTRQKLKLKLREILKTTAVLVGLLDRPEKIGPVHKPSPDPPYREYVCKPLGPSRNSNSKEQERL